MVTRTPSIGPPHDGVTRVHMSVCVTAGPMALATRRVGSKFEATTDAPFGDGPAVVAEL
jgi:hypothetical protein